MDARAKSAGLAAAGSAYNNSDISGNTNLLWVVTSAEMRARYNKSFIEL